MTSLAHIINPVKVSESSDLYHAQPITFESMLRAKSFSDSKEISLFTTQYTEDKVIIPNGFTILSDLEKSVLDINLDLKQRKLPLIKDIINKLNENSTAEYFCYTNADIGLMPYFYDVVFSYIQKGHDALVINRRRLSNQYKSIKELPQIYADMGKSHPGFDCFIFKKELVEKMELGNICVGIPFIGVAMAHNLFCLADNPAFIPDEHLTFHIGEDILPTRNNPFYTHNRDEFEKVVFPTLKEYFDVRKFPYATLPFYERALKWMLNPSLFTLDFLKEESKGIKAKLDEIRWRILQK